MQKVFNILNPTKKRKKAKLLRITPLAEKPKNELKLENTISDEVEQRFKGIEETIKKLFLAQNEKKPETKEEVKPEVKEEKKPEFVELNSGQQVVIMAQKLSEIGFEPKQIVRNLVAHFEPEQKVQNTPPNLFSGETIEKEKTVKERSVEQMKNFLKKRGVR